MAEYDKGRYYWIKLTDRFMTSDTVDFLMSQKDGANYVVLYQMLCLKTVNNHGVMARRLGEMIIPYEIEKIQRDCKWFSIDTVRIALELYKKLGLIFENNDGILEISEFDRLIGSQTYGAEKKQIQRAEDKCPPICPPDKEIKRLRDKENREEDIDKKKEQEKKIQEFSDVVRRIYEFWNEKRIIPHRALTKEMNSAVEKALKSYSEEEIKTYIDRYAKVIEDKSYFFDYKWSLKDFLSRKEGISSFTDEGSKWVNYCAASKCTKVSRRLEDEKGKWCMPKDDLDDYPF